MAEASGSQTFFFISMDTLRIYLAQISMSKLSEFEEISSKFFIKINLRTKIYLKQMVFSFRAFKNL